MCVVINIIYIKINLTRKNNLILQLIFCEKISNGKTFSWYKKSAKKLHNENLFPFWILYTETCFCKNIFPSCIFLDLLLIQRKHVFIVMFETEKIYNKIMITLYIYI